MNENHQADYRWQWLDLIDNDPTLTATAHHTAYVLARKYVNSRTHQAHPSQTQLARTMRRARNTVHDALQELAQNGYLDIRHGPPAQGRNHVYTLKTPQVECSTTEHSGPKRNKRDSQKTKHAKA